MHCRWRSSARVGRSTATTSGLRPRTCDGVELSNKGTASRVLYLYYHCTLGQQCTGNCEEMTTRSSAVIGALPIWQQSKQATPINGILPFSNSPCG